MREGNTWKYLKYAIGEILLVMIGILLALQVNIWNEKRKTEVLEIQFMNRLIEDLAIDTTYYAHRAERSQYVVNTNRQVMQLMYRTQESVEDVKNLYNQIKWDSEYLTTQNSTYDELANSGNIGIFSNQELKKSIVHYYRENEKAAKQVGEWDEVTTRHMIHWGQVAPNSIKLVPQNDDVFANLPFQIDEWDYLNDPSSEEFQTLTYTLSIYKIKHTDLLDSFLTLKGLSTQLITDIQLELESRN